jgi:phasin
MATDSFMTPEIPQGLRDLLKLSIEQARRAFETFVATSEKTWKSIETSSQAARNSMQGLNEKIAEITRANADSSFALALELAESKDISQAMELQSEHVRKQMETFARQLEEIRDLAAQAIQDSNQARSGSMSG